MFNLDNYEPVEARIHRFWADHGLDGCITTDIVEIMRTPDGKPVQYIVKATVMVKGGILATGFAEEIVGASPVNRTSALENAETSALGRALANADYAKQGSRPSREEMSKVMHDDKPTNLGTNPPGTPSSGPAARSASGPASDKQIGMLKGLMRKQNIPEHVLSDYAKDQLGFELPAEGLNRLGKAQASALIDAMSKMPFTQPERSSEPVVNDPWADAPMIDPITGEAAH